MGILITIIVLIAIIMALTGVFGAILPALPGPPLCFASLLTVYFACPGQIDFELLMWMLGITLLVTVLDYIAPIILTKLGGGSKPAMWGTTIGMIAGLFFMPIGLVAGPLVGAFIGEFLHDARLGHSTKVAAMSFISFLLSTGFKLVASLVMTYYTIAAVWNHTIH